MVPSDFPFIEILTNEKLAKKFKVNGLKTIEEKFSWGHVIEEFDEIYGLFSICCPYLESGYKPSLEHQGDQ